MNKLFMTAILSLVSLQSFASSIESKSDARTLFLVNKMNESCPSEFQEIILKKISILDIVRFEDREDEKSKIITVLKAGFYPHPLTGPHPQVIRILKVTQVQKEGPIPADAGPFYNTNCELLDSKGNKLKQ